MTFVLARHQLALGVKPRDAVRGFGTGRLDVAIDRPILPGFEDSNWPATARARAEDGFTRLRPQPNGTYVLLRDARFTTPVTLRIVDHDHVYTPRKLSVAVGGGAPIKIEPTLFPAAAYPISPRATTIRGRVVDSSKQPRRWARIEARRAGGGPFVGHAHGDERGEFLLVLEPDLITIGDLPETADVQITAYVANAPPVPSPAYVRERDPYWDVPVESVTAGASSSNPVLSGIQRPSAYTLSRTVTVTVELGFLRSKVEIEIP